MTDPLVLQPARIDEKDIKVLRSLLGLAADQIGEDWSIELDGDAGVQLVDVDNREGEAMWKQLLRERKPTVALSKRRDFEAPYLLHKPLRMNELKKVLAELSVVATEQTEQDAWQPMILGGGDALPLAEHLRRHSWTRPVSLIFDDQPELIVDPGSGVWYTGASDRELAGLLARECHVRDAVPLTSAEMVERVEGLEQNNLTTLKWRAGLAQSRGALHPDLAGSVTFMLPQVPLQALSDTSYSRQARILIKGPVDADTLMVESRTRAEDVAEFLNACHACGFLLINRPSDSESVGVAASG